MSLWVFLPCGKEVTCKLPAALKGLKYSAAAFWGADGLSTTTEGWYPMFYIFKPRERENVSLVKDGGIEGIA